MLFLQKRDIFIGKIQVIQIVYDLLQPGHNGITASIGYLPEEHIKIGDVICHIPVSYTHLAFQEPITFKEFFEMILQK